MQAFDARAAGGNVDVDTARALLMGLVRACHLQAFKHRLPQGEIAETR